MSYSSPLIVYFCRFHIHTITYNLISIYDKVVYNPTEPIVGPDPGLGGNGGVTVRKFAQVIKISNLKKLQL